MLSRHRVLRLLAPAGLAVSAIAVAGLFVGPGGSMRPQAATAAGGLSVEPCLEVAVGQTFDVNIVVSDVSRLLAWDILYAYKSDTLEVTAKNVRRLLEALPNSNVFDFSDPVPNRTGIYRIAAADTGGADAAESGSGVLATLTLRAKQPGISWSAVYRGDVDGNGTTDLGPTLTALGGEHIGDIDGDGIFDGSISAGQIAVDTRCVNPVPSAPAPQGIGFSKPSGTPVVDTTDPTASPQASGDGSPTPEATGTPSSPSPTATRGSVTVDPKTNGGSGSSVPDWLIALMAGSATFGVVFSYIVYRSARRPA